MSYLIKEDDEFLYLYRYLHHEPDSYSAWELLPGGKQKYSQAVHDGEHFAAYELRMDYRIRKSDGQVFIDEVK